MKYLLIEPINKSPYPPLGLMRIATMLQSLDKDAEIIEHSSDDLSQLPLDIDEIYITTLFTWEIPKVKAVIKDLREKYPEVKIHIGGIAATIAKEEFIDFIQNMELHTKLHPIAENMPPDYTKTFGRKLKTSLTSVTRGCVRNCKFCFVPNMEGRINYRKNWEQDISDKFSRITFWDNNFLAIPTFEQLVAKISTYNKTVDFNQGLDAYYFTDEKAKILTSLKLDCLRFAFDVKEKEKYVVKAINNAHKYYNGEVSCYVLYGFNDTPEELYYRINILNELGAFAYPMRYRSNLAVKTRPIPDGWTKEVIRGFELTLHFYYRKGMISAKREPFIDMYGKTPEEFIKKMEDIYYYDLSLRKKQIG